MKTNSKFLSRSLILLSVLLYSSCDEIADELMDCVINKGPVLSMKILDGGSINTFYSEYVRASIQNEPHDDDYDYYFDIQGSLPDGIEAVINFREVIFEGTPIEAGRFEFTVYVTVVGPEYWDEDMNSWDDDLCFNSNSRDYRIVITQ